MARRAPEAPAGGTPVAPLQGEARVTPAESPRRGPPPSVPPEVELAERLRTGASLVGIDLREVRLVDFVLDGKNLARAKFSEAKLVRCSFKGCSLAGAVFFGATLEDVCFVRADLEGADLDYASLLDVNFEGARIRGALLPGRALGRARVEESVRTGVRVRLTTRRADEE